MYISVYLTIIATLIITPVFTDDVCVNQRCQCDKDKINVNCDSKKWISLDGIDFPPSVTKLTIIGSNLRFDNANDRAKIENLPKLSDLSLNQNPLGVIPPFNNTNIRFLSLQDTSLTSAEIPSSYNCSSLQTLTLSSNKIRTIKENDFLILRNVKLNKLTLDSASLTSIDQNAFTPLTQLQALSLQNNQLKSCEFLPNIPLLSSIKLDGNQFTSLPQQLSIQGRIKSYSFTQNNISIIDESSPLSQWVKANYTNVKIYLANNPLNCCASFWFIRLLKTSPQFVADASLLTCAAPSAFSGKFLIKLNPDEMDCTDKPWWNANRIIGIVTVIVIVISISVGVFLFIRFRQHPSRSGYAAIGGNDDNAYRNTEESPNSGPVFPRPDDYEDNHTGHIYADPDYMGSIAPSEAQTTNYGAIADDESRAGGEEIQEGRLRSVIA